MVIISVIKGCIRIIEQLTDSIDPNPHIQLLRECVRKSLEMIVQLTQIPEDELFKICLDFWHFLATDIMNNPKNSKDIAANIGMDFCSVLSGSFLSQHVFPDVFAQIE
jgi:hypothetical protein